MQEAAGRPSGSDVGLISNVAIRYGAQVTVLAEPKERSGHWVAQALAPGAGVVTIQCERRLSTGERFIVVARSETSSSLFLHWVLLVEHLEELAEAAEQRALEILRAR